jgi:hypothetical protein
LPPNLIIASTVATSNIRTVEHHRLDQKMAGVDEVIE